jgi:hypothetical protein
MMRIWSIVTLTLVALVLGTSFAHVLQWPAKLQYDGALYTHLHTSLYRYWGPPSITGYMEPAATFAVLVLAVLVRDDRHALGLVAVAAGVLLVAFPVVFFWRVAPSNAAFWDAARSGTVPVDWRAWRDRWEAGHALRFILHLTAFALLAAAVTGRNAVTMRSEHRLLHEGRQEHSTA